MAEDVVQWDLSPGKAAQVANTGRASPCLLKSWGLCSAKGGRWISRKDAVQGEQEDRPTRRVSQEEARHTNIWPSCAWQAKGLQVIYIFQYVAGDAACHPSHGPSG